MKKRYLCTLLRRVGMSSLIEMAAKIEVIAVPGDAVITTTPAFIK